MTDGIDPTRPRRDADLPHFDPPPAHKAVPRASLDEGNWPDASFGPLPRVRADVPSQRVADHSPKELVQSKLDAFLERATPCFLVDGESVTVPLPFRMTVDPTKLSANDEWHRREGTVSQNQKELQAAAASVGLGDADHLELFRSGRATPEDVQKVTQALIDRGRLRSDGALTAASRIRNMMFDHGLGIDCAGYVQQDFLASRGLRREQTRLNPEIANEDLRRLDREGFDRVPIEAAQPGDILVLDPPPGSPDPGHTLMVYDRREATSEELKQLRTQCGFETGHVTAYVVDSSFGSHATANEGGVMRQTWFRNDDDEQKRWARKDPSDGAFNVWSGVDKDHPNQPARDRPYFGHVIRGVYRPLEDSP